MRYFAARLIILYFILRRTHRHPDASALIVSASLVRERPSRWRTGLILCRVQIGSRRWLTVRVDLVCVRKSRPCTKHRTSYCIQQSVSIAGNHCFHNRKFSSWNILRCPFWQEGCLYRSVRLQYCSQLVTPLQVATACANLYSLLVRGGSSDAGMRP